jgi:hypothetical protein
MVRMATDVALVLLAAAAIEQPVVGPRRAATVTTAGRSSRLHCRLYFGCAPVQNASVKDAQR